MLKKIIIESLKPKGLFILEVFSQNQIDKKSGGPKNIDLLYTKNSFSDLLNQFDHFELNEVDIKLSEGPLHSGDASVIRITGIK